MKLQIPERKFIYLIFIAITVRIILMSISFSNGEDSFFLHDSYRYLGLGENYFNHGLYAETLDQPIFESIFTPPGYPIFLYFLNKLGGPILIVAIQILLQLLTAFFIWKISTNFLKLSEKIVTGILLFYLIDIPTIVLGNLLMTETLFTTLFIGGLYFYLSFNFNNKKHNHLIFTSVLWGFACLVRPILFYFPLFLTILSLVLVIKKNRLRYMFLLLIPFYIITGIWSFRNYQKYDRWFYSYQGHFNIVYYQAATIYAQNNNLQINEARNEIYEQGLEKTTINNGVANPTEFYDNLLIIAKDIIKENPVFLFKNILNAEVNLFFRPVTDYLKITLGSKLAFHSRGKYTNLFLDLSTYYQIIVNISTFILLLVGCTILFKIDVKIFYFFLILIIYFMIVCSGPEIEGRFRVPIVPILLILAGIGFEFIIKKFWKEKKLHQ